MKKKEYRIQLGRAQTIIDRWMGRYNKLVHISETISNELTEALTIIRDKNREIDSLQQFIFSDHKPAYSIVQGDGKVPALLNGIAYWRQCYSNYVKEGMDPSLVLEDMINHFNTYINYLHENNNATVYGLE